MHNATLKLALMGQRRKLPLLLYSAQKTDYVEFDVQSQRNSSVGEKQCTSPGENTSVQLSGKGLLLVARCGDNQQLLAWVSTNGAITWQRHRHKECLSHAGRSAHGQRCDCTDNWAWGLALWLNANGDGRD